MRSLILSMCLLGCSDYKFAAKETGTLSVSPETVEREGACGYEEHTVSLTSVGDYAVKVSAMSIQGEGWALLDAPHLPVTMEPGDSVEVKVLGNEGSAHLVVDSDDPDGRRRRVPLVGGANEPPSLSWVSAGPGDVVEPGDRLVVRVADSTDASEDLLVSWSSDVDGPIGVAYGDETGQAATAWDEATGGDHTLTATVTDLCGTTTSVDLGICRQEGYLTAGLDLSTWTLSGTATYDTGNDWVELTDVASTFQTGSAFQTTATTGNRVELNFSFYASGGTGADGFAVTALDMDRATTYLAHPGGCLGYGGGGACPGSDPLYGWTVELDTHFNADIDPTADDHVSFHFDGDVGGYETYAVLPDVEDEAWHDMTIQVVAPRVTVAVDGVVYIDQDIEGYYDFPAEVGFTAATGGETNYHLIDALKVIEDVCE